MNNYKDKRVIVIGGSGETGRRILSDLSHRFPDIRFSSAARREQRHLPSVDNIDAVKLDINDKDTSAAALADYDLAIIALGPMDKYGSIPHQACIAAGVDAIDINDNLEAADQILALHDQAHDHGRLILTGMGFVPGLSTLMLSQLARNKASPSGDYRCRIYMGAAYGGGETSPYAMLASFKRNVCSLIDGRRSLIPTPWKDEHSRFRFPSQSKSLDLIPFATPEIAGLSNHRCADELAINNLDSRYHVQFLSQGFAKLLSRFELSQKRADYFARKFFSGGQSVKTRKKADPDTTLIVYPDDRLDDGLIVHGVISSYDFTAQMACAAFDLWISNKLQGYQGVYPTELLDASSNQQLIDALASRGVTIRESTEQNFSEADIHFGWASQAPLAVEQLRNYGKNWYTIERPHPKMAGLQKRFLFESDIWKSLKQALGGIGLVSFVIKVMRRWSSHNKRLQRFRDIQDSGSASRWRAITKDMSMFTSGYSSARDVLGKQKALSLYQQMFLDTGKMEMRWLWPSPDAFTCFSSGAGEAVHRYWLAFMKNYAALGLFDLSVEDVDEQKKKYTISNCAYASMFSQLDCPELSNMVRKMEREALLHMSSKANMDISWQINVDGSAIVTMEW